MSYCGSKMLTFGALLVLMVFCAESRLLNIGNGNDKPPLNNILSNGIPQLPPNNGNKERPQFGFLGNGKPQFRPFGFFAGKQQQCIHVNTTFGTKVPNDSLTYTETIQSFSKFPLSRNIFTIEYNATNGGRITFINALDNSHDCRCLHNLVNLTGGQINSSYVQLSLQTESPRCNLDFDVLFYTSV